MGFIWIECHDEANAAYNRYIKVETNAQAVEMYREMITKYPSKIKDIKELGGKTIACWCKVGEPCHGDILIEKFIEEINAPF